MSDTDFAEYDSKVTFMFPGQGAQYMGMAADICDEVSCKTSFRKSRDFRGSSSSSISSGKLRSNRDVYLWWITTPTEAVASCRFSCLSRIVSSRRQWTLKPIFLMKTCQQKHVCWLAGRRPFVGAAFEIGSWASRVCLWRVSFFLSFFLRRGENMFWWLRSVWMMC